ncbi:aminotransferase class III-fold pyridoxal phosphate-dependent enzyme, partial [Pirellulales bacterium]|nr:aminotransferase class III-fold pyridoxal phosphate-dependent enzyme [Pirellulales bacterium]
MLAVLRAFGPRRLLFGSDYPVSNLIGRSSSLGDGFAWFYEHNVDWEDAEIGRRTIVGMESLLALRQACQLANLTDGDVECIFRENASRELGLNEDSNQRGQTLYARARQIIPGGTQLLSKRPEMFAPERWPPYFAEARDVRVIDIDGREFVDMSSMSVGACLLGYADPDVNAAVSRRVMLGAMSSLNSADEVALAELLLEIHPWADSVRYARGGGEALAVAVRIARASTGRSKIAICGYHGWQDWYLAANVSVETGHDPLAGHLLAGLKPAGVPRELAGTVLPFRYNCPDELDAIVARHGADLAAIVMEPTRHQSPEPGFLEKVRQLADRTGAVLVFDEVSAGWRICLGGAHLQFEVRPDMAVFSKAIANGYPMAAILGVRTVMQAAQESFISSTMWTDGVGPAAALATLRKFQQHDVP